MLLTFFGNAAILIVEIVVVEMDSCPDSNSLVEDRLSSFFCNKSSVYGVGDSTKSKSISREETRIPLICYISQPHKYICKTAIFCNIYHCHIPIMLKNQSQQDALVLLDVLLLYNHFQMKSLFFSYLLKNPSSLYIAHFKYIS